MPNSDKKQEIQVSKLLEHVPNKFMLCVAASRRARQIKDNLHNAGVLEEIPTIPVLEALREIMAGKIIVSLRPEREETQETALESKTADSRKEKGETDSKDEKKTKESKSKSKSKSLAA